MTQLSFAWILSLLLTGCSGEPYPDAVAGAGFCLVFIIGWIVGAAMGSRERNRQRDEIKILRQDLAGWKQAADYWQKKAGFRITPDRPSPAEEIDFRLDCKRAARQEWDRKVSEDIAELIAGAEEEDAGGC